MLLLKDGTLVIPVTEDVYRSTKRVLIEHENEGTLYYADEIKICQCCGEKIKEDKMVNNVLDSKEASMTRVDSNSYFKKAIDYCYELYPHCGWHNIYTHARLSVMWAYGAKSVNKMPYDKQEEANNLLISIVESVIETRLNEDRSKLDDTVQIKPKEDYSRWNDAVFNGEYYGGK